jgi:hypothetical protein
LYKVEITYSSGREEVPVPPSLNSGAACHTFQDYTQSSLLFYHSDSLSAMEILPLPLNPTSKAEEVPYVSTERYDGGSFLGYPARHGRPEMVTPSYPPGTDFNMREKANPTPIRELEAFYQTWLYFGLLCEFAEVNSDSPGAPPLEVSLNFSERCSSFWLKLQELLKMILAISHSSWNILFLDTPEEVC